MNFKRMARHYRYQVNGTGSRAQDLLTELASNPQRDYRCTHARCYLRGWYRHLSKALGSENRLGDLNRSWLSLVKLSKLVKANEELDKIPAEKIEQALILAETAKKQLDQFLKKLPKLIEKSLTRSVRASGICLK